MLKPYVKSIFQILGFDIYRRSSLFPGNPFDAQKKLLMSMGISSPVIFDIGAHRGETVKQYRVRFPKSIIYCFEPFPDSLEYLSKTFRDSPDTKIIPLAVAEQSGHRTLYVNEIDATNSLLPAASSTRKYLPGKRVTKATMQVAVTSVDDFVKKNRVGSIHILKMDIQGSELLALHGSEKTLKEKRIPLIFTEIMFTPHYENQPLFYQIWDFLARSRYSLLDIYYLQRAKNGQLRYANALFVSAEVRKTVIDRYPEEY